VPRVNAKIYEYMRAGRPILAMTDPGDVADFARGSGLGVVVPPRDEAAIATAIRDAVARRDGAKPPLRPDEAFIARFSNDALTAGLARVLASVAR
jgi:glycosyltransferase involved in cell wall biosynthesis